MPLVSVGIPVYNGGRFVAAAIESVLSQSMADLELVICDNGSTDGTEALCRRYAALDARVCYFRNPSNLGAAGNFCRAFDLSTGRYFRWLASDDLIGPSSLEKCAALLDANPDAILACTRANVIGAAGELLHAYTADQALCQNSALERFRQVTLQDPWCNAQYGLMRRETLARTARMGAFSGSDCTLLAELALHGRFVEVPEALFMRRVHPGAYSHVLSDEQVRAFYTPAARGRPLPMLRTWRHLVENVGAVMRAPLRLSERCLLLSHLLRVAWWKKRQLALELARRVGASLAFRPQRSSDAGINDAHNADRPKGG